MTFIFGALGRDTIWVLADRRLSIGPKSVKEDARKITFLETTDGVAMLGYAGLGATALRTEPSDWMSAVLRGRNLPLEVSLGIIADVMQREVLPHIKMFPREMIASHHIYVPAFVNGKAKLYYIDLVLSDDRKNLSSKYVVETAGEVPRRPPFLFAGGSGAAHVPKDVELGRKLRRLVKAHDRGCLTPLTVADELAALNLAVHSKDPSVGPNCIVAWRRRKGARHGGGSSHQCYAGSERARDDAFLATTAQGMDVSSLLQAVMPTMMDHLAKVARGEPHELDADLMNKLVSKLPTTPDERLR